MIRNLLVAGLLVVSLLAVGTGSTGAQQSDEDWQTLTEDDITIKYKEGYESDAQTALEQLTWIRERLRANMSEAAYYGGKIVFKIHPREYGPQATYENPPVIQMGAFSITDERRPQYLRMLAHEYVNILTWHYVEETGGHNFNEWNPYWVEEGIAEYFAIHKVSKDIEDGAHTGEVESMKELVRSDVGYFEVMTRSPEPGGHLLIAYFIDTYGQDELWAVLANDAETFEGAITDELGITYAQFKDGWLRWAEANVGGNYSVGQRERIQSLEDQLQQRNQTIDSLRGQLARQNQTIRALRDQLDHQNRTIRELRAQLERRNRTIRSLRNESSTADVPPATTTQTTRLDTDRTQDVASETPPLQATDGTATPAATSGRGRLGILPVIVALLFALIGFYSRKY